MSLVITILAAGKGTRMRSLLPKVLQPLAKEPLLQHVINTARQLDPDEILGVIGHKAESVKKVISDPMVQWIEQADQLGTGHAVLQTLKYLKPKDKVLILYGDVPLTRKETLQDLLSLVDAEHPLALLTINLDNPAGYGRIIRDIHLNVTQIVEEKEASEAQKQVKEVNTGILAVSAEALHRWLLQLDNQNAQNEYYLTDIIAMCVAEGYPVQTTQPKDEIEVLGVNNKMQLQALERRYQFQQAQSLMQQGVTLIDAYRIDIRGSIEVGMDVQIDVNVIFEGKVTLGDNVKIGANCILRNTTVERGTQIEANSLLDHCQVGENCVIGPYARLRPGSNLQADVKIGNFVETKNAVIGKGSKVNHLSYIGDTQMGEHCNIGAGTITCNYDGVHKHQTRIGNYVFIGSDTQLIAPVQVGDHATIGAGSTITKDATANELTLSRSKQLSIKGWKKPVKTKS